MALNGLYCADVLLRNYSLTHSLTHLVDKYYCSLLIMYFYASANVVVRSIMYLGCS